MKVSLNWVKQFTDVTLSAGELVEKIGSQLGAVEEVINLGERYQGIIVAKVVVCQKHPNADKLSLCKIDDAGVVQNVERDEQGLVQVICGAPNVREGLTVAWLPPGTTVPSSFSIEPFVLDVRELRGIASNGMLASASELAIGDDHSGIIELDDRIAAGTDFAEYFELNDYIIDIENKMFTHRPDCFGILGVAREISGISGVGFTSPDWYKQPLGRMKPAGDRRSIKYANNAGNLVPRFTLLTMDDIKVAPSPLMMQIELAKVGLRPINNIVDITNYIMYLTGQPTHAYDADKLAKYGELSIETRLSRKGDKIALLNGKLVELTDDQTVLITSNDIPVGIAGCMGGADTEVDNNTTNVVLECANFDMYSIRRSSMKYGLFTDAVTRFNKGQSNLQNEVVIEQMATLVQSIAGGRVSSDLIDNKTDLVIPRSSVQVSADFINSRLGSSLSEVEIVKLLENVEFIVHTQDGLLDITPPFWRTDIALSEDIVEEVGRLYGYDNLPLSLPLRDLSPVAPDERLENKKYIRNALSRLGANEALTYSFVPQSLIDKSGQQSDLAFKISNALSPDLQYYRLSLTPSLIDKVHANIKLGFNEFVLFEQGISHIKSAIGLDGLPEESDRLSLVCARSDKISANSGSAYYLAKKYLDELLPDNTTFTHLSDATKISESIAQLSAPFEPSRSALIHLDEDTIGVVGEFSGPVKKAFKLPDFTAGFEIITKTIGRKDVNYVPLSRYPNIEQDVTLKVSDSISFSGLQSCLEVSLPSSDELRCRVLPQGIYKKDNDTRNITFRIKITPYNQTLKTEYVNSMLSDALRTVSATTGAERV